MLQHVLLGDLAPLCLLAGLTGPMLRPLLAFRPVERLRVLANPFVALPLWAANLYVWHLPVPLRGGASEHSVVHALEHICFFTRRHRRVAAGARDAAGAGVVRHRREARLHRVVRLVETVLGNVFIWSGAVFYGVYEHAATSSGGSRRSQDQGLRAR